jgi:hypothetical protein
LLIVLPGEAGARAIPSRIVFLRSLNFTTPEQAIFTPCRRNFRSCKRGHTRRQAHRSQGASAPNAYRARPPPRPRRAASSFSSRAGRALGCVRWARENLCGTDCVHVWEGRTRASRSARGRVLYETSRGMRDFPWPRAVGRQRWAAIRDYLACMRAPPADTVCVRVCSVSFEHDPFAPPNPRSPGMCHGSISFARAHCSARCV